MFEVAIILFMVAFAALMLRSMTRGASGGSGSGFRLPG